MPLVCVDDGTEHPDDAAFCMKCGRAFRDEPVVKRESKVDEMRWHHKVFFSLLGVTGVVLIWRGIWDLVDQAPVLNAPLASVILGLVLVAIAGAFFELL